jgi:VanZ family protein
LRRKLLVALGWAWVGAIVWLSVTPAPPKVDFQQSDKVGHLLAYGSLMLWFCFLYPATKTRTGYAAAFVGMGVGLEFVQRALGYRSYEVLDMIADAAGVLLGWAAAVLVHRIRVR